MQHEPPQAKAFAEKFILMAITIAGITQDGAAYIAQMPTNLMKATGDRTYIEQAIPHALMNPQGFINLHLS